MSCPHPWDSFSHQFPFLTVAGNPAGNHHPKGCKTHNYIGSPHVNGIKDPAINYQLQDFQAGKTPPAWPFLKPPISAKEHPPKVHCCCARRLSLGPSPGRQIGPQPHCHLDSLHWNNQGPEPIEHWTVVEEGNSKVGNYPPLKLSEVAPDLKKNPKGKGSSSNSHFSPLLLLVSGAVVRWKVGWSLKRFMNKQ